MNPKYKKRQPGKAGASKFLVEAGESRTPLSISETISNSIPHVSYLSTSSVLETSFRQASYSTNFECNPSKLLPQLLDQLIALVPIQLRIVKLCLGINPISPSCIECSDRDRLLITPRKA